MLTWVYFRYFEDNHQGKIRFKTRNSGCGRINSVVAFDNKERIQSSATFVEHFLLLAVEITEVKKKRPGVAFKMHTVMNQSELLFTKAL